MAATIDKSPGVDKAGSNAAAGTTSAVGVDIQGVQAQLNKLGGTNRPSTGDHGKDVQAFADAISATVRRIGARVDQLSGSRAGVTDGKQALANQNGMDASHAQMGQVQDTVGRFNQALHQADSPLRLQLGTGGVQVVNVKSGSEQTGMRPEMSARASWLDGVTGAAPGDGSTLPNMDRAVDRATQEQPLFKAIKAALDEALVNVNTQNQGPSEAARAQTRSDAQQQQQQQQQGQNQPPLMSALLAALPKAMESMRASRSRAGGQTDAVGEADGTAGVSALAADAGQDAGGVVGTDPTAARGVMSGTGAKGAPAAGGGAGAKAAANAAGGAGTKGLMGRPTGVSVDDQDSAPNASDDPYALVGGSVANQAKLLDAGTKAAAAAAGGPAPTRAGARTLATAGAPAVAATAGGGGRALAAGDGTDTGTDGTTDPTTTAALNAGYGDVYLQNVDVNAMVQSVLLQAYQDAQKTLQITAQRIQDINDKKKALRGALSAARLAGSDKAAQLIQTQIDNAGDDQQMIQLSLTNQTNAQQQLLGMISNLAKAGNDNSMAIIRHIGGG